MKLSKWFEFDAAHFLPNVPEQHKCRRMHGHTYRVVFTIDGDVDADGFTAGLDFSDIARECAAVQGVLDHRILNDIAGLHNPTAENLAIWIAQFWGQFVSHPLSSVTVCESTSTSCTYEP